MRATLVRNVVRATVFALALPAMLASAVAQQPATPYIEIGVDPAALVTRPLGTLESVRGTAPCSETYESTTLVNPSLLVRASYVLDNHDHPLGAVTLRGLRLSLGIDDLTSEWAAPSERYPSYNEVSGEYTEVETQFAARYDLSYLRTSAELEIGLGSNVGARIGPSVSLPLKASSVQQESIVSPSGATFLDRTQRRELTEGTGAIDDAGVRVGVGFGVGYRLPLGRRLFFEPSASVDVGITSVQPSWSPLELRLGIGIGYALFTDPEPVQVPVVPEPVVIEHKPEPFAASVDVRLASDATIELRRQIVSRYIPIIPVVFFGEKERTIASRYRPIDARSTSEFSEQAISTQADEAHRDVMNVLGARLRLHDRATLTLTGTTSEDESDREALARSRAEAVAEYFERAWGIDRARIAVRARVTPAVPTSSDTEEGRAENRRVELAVSDETLLAPVHQRTVEPVLEPHAISFVASAQANRPIARWSLNIGGADGRRIDGSGPVPETITWELEQDDRERLLAGGSSQFRLTVEDAAGASATSSARTLPLRLDTTVTVATSASRPDNAAEFLLITFEFDQARLTDRGRRELETITRRIGGASSVSVTGYTDRIGEAEHNLALARARAERVAAALPKAASLEVRGADPSEAPYTNDTPEGRFLSRTVRVVIVNPQ